MQRVVIYWMLSLVILVGGAPLVCGDDRCAVTEFDRFGLSLAHALRSGPLDYLMESLTWLGSLLVLVPLTGAGAWFFYRSGHRRQAGFVILALLTASALSHLSKLWVARPRPDLFAVWSSMPGDWSYPSAHAMQVTAAALAWFLVSGRHLAVWAATLSLVVLLVSLSRIYLQVHFPSDVIVGVLAAGLWVGGLYALFFQRPVSHKTRRVRRGAA